ncbi:MAG: hypothetical protein ACNI3A_11365 [Desulfovibrio sp.]|uniref:hypothetical protein n=1 Tax=Desulfovibrio sp. 7SRBS1 TaxID=3378064 RepID=UPI003B404BB0
MNPDELVNQDVKSNAFREGKAENKSEMMKKARGFLKSFTYFDRYYRVDNTGIHPAEVSVSVLVLKDFPAYWHPA